MSMYECIWVDHLVDVEKYLAVLKEEFGAQDNPHQAGTYLIGDPALPFYKPRLINEQLAITGFNGVALSPDLLRALAAHPDLAPPTARVHWTFEQELLTHGTLESLGRRLGGKER